MRRHASLVLLAVGLAGCTGAPGRSKTARALRSWTATAGRYVERGWHHLRPRRIEHTINAVGKETKAVVPPRARRIAGTAAKVGAAVATGGAAGAASVLLSPPQK